MELPVDGVGLRCFVAGAVDGPDDPLWTGCLLASRWLNGPSISDSESDAGIMNTRERIARYGACLMTNDHWARERRTISSEQRPARIEDVVMSKGEVG